jgi:pimeloyl-ACP methyl ester carboxylesterase
MDTVLLLHCSGSSGAQWRSLAEKLGSRYRVIAPDLTSDSSLARAAAPIRSILGRLDAPAHLVGHSYGGGVALQVARTRPELLRSLTLIEPSAFHLLRGGNAIDAVALREITGVAARTNADLSCGDLMAGFGRFVDYWSGPGSWDAIPAEKRAAFAPLLAGIALNFQALLSEPAEIEDVRGLPVPTLLLQGGRTTLPSRRVCERLRDALPGAQFRVVPGAGHMLPLTHRDAVNALVAEYLGTAATKWRAAA